MNTKQGISFSFLISRILGVFIVGMGLIYAVQTGRLEYIFWSIIAAAVVLLVGGRFITGIFAETKEIKGDKMFCAHCGKENPPATAKFCLSCGKELTPHLGRMNILLLLFLSIITFEMYIPIWFLVKRQAINSLASTKKLGSGAPIFVLLIYGIGAILLFAPLGFTETSLDMISDFIPLIGGILVIALSFKVRHIFDEHFNLKQQRNIKFSGVATFFFTILYLQYKINRIEKGTIS